MCYNRNTLVYCVKCFKRMVGDIRILKKILIKYNNLNTIEGKELIVQRCNDGIAYETYILCEEYFFKIFGDKFIDRIEL